MKRLLTMLPLLALCALAPAVIPGAARAADEDKVPYWASIDADVANMRVGPGHTYKIDWVYRRQHLPVKIIRREGPWRQIEDPDGDKGWMRDLLLSRRRGAIVKGKEPVEMRAGGSDSSPVLWRVEPGVVGQLGDCKQGWCAFDTDGHRGFVRAGALWGTGEP
ncbi:SH3 domain-containing protein [Novosphingobium beihaiensis]|uniref:SH3 domain-containing protein n=1 Tax=Novosphingobium beihaiensis TaxID=2930389 RepID=A0ABT0BMH2_9SPHN|nr:SH3 domain-containing protein [Novosphingobium beihaiensis]MCJ2186173.1 SH3 domain-containing protein [Novosphingobium beihaiensis]